MVFTIYDFNFTIYDSYLFAIFCLLVISEGLSFLYLELTWNF